MASITASEEAAAILTRNCTQCGEPVHRKANRPKSASERCFCNRTCMAKWQAQHFAGPRSPTWKGGQEERSCAVCGTAFFVYASQCKDRPRQCCSTACANKHRSQIASGERSFRWSNLFVTCQQCGAAFRVIPAHIKRGRGKFCNRSCRSKWMSEHGTGANNPNWRGGYAIYYGPNWTAQQRAARKRDKYVCQHCGKRQKKRGRAFDVHHIKPFREFGYVYGVNDHYLAANDLPNLVTLCRQCHWLAEYGKIALQQRFV